ncbi:carbamoyl-phosphate synthase large chain [Culex quinquefasciatus]|uniref:Carbamoyl-phosphate synthase large chain n=1 Tax=Culex quinquefasciatus TaxID=7176 RepID=B0XGY4_CULQU|nr:carbamoyl-phosphate synthase large chain [Culex quinquefasciatus]|eukprot:XP_001868906.1 carbamoyl-phosphate synthase large chain [Culex quinquefasciatus]
MKNHTGCMSSRTIVKLPRFIDGDTEHDSLVKELAQKGDDYDVEVDGHDRVAEAFVELAQEGASLRSCGTAFDGGLEMILPLLLTTFNEDRLSLEDLIAMFYKNPKWNFGLPEQPNTYGEDDFNEEWIITEVPPHYKARWSSFAGIKVKGRVYRKPTVAPSVEKINGSLDGLDFLTLRKIISDTTRRYFWENGHTNAVFSKLLAGNESYSEFTLRKPLKTTQLLHFLASAVTPPATTARTSSFRSPLDDLLRGKIMASVFYEVSARTSCSVTGAMQCLEGRVIYMNETSSSVKKGEVSIFVMAGYSDVVVLRHPEPAAVSKASHHCRKPLIKAGDGIGEHPTQSLLDIFTIREEIGTVNGLNIIIARQLTLYNADVRYVSPKSLDMPEKITKLVKARSQSALLA